MSHLLKWRVALLAAVVLLLTAGAWQRASAEEDLVQIVKGTVKSVDKGTKTMVVKSADGTEQTNMHFEWDGKPDDQTEMHLIGHVEAKKPTP